MRCSIGIIRPARAVLRRPRRGPPAPAGHCSLGRSAASLADAPVLLLLYPLLKLRDCLHCRSIVGQRLDSKPAKEAGSGLTALTARAQHVGSTGEHLVTSATAIIWLCCASWDAQASGELNLLFAPELGLLTEVALLSSGGLSGQTLPDAASAAASTALPALLSLPGTRPAGSRSWGEAVLGDVAGDSASRLLLTLESGSLPGGLMGLPGRCLSAAMSTLSCVAAGCDISTGFACIVCSAGCTSDTALLSPFKVRFPSPGARTIAKYASCFGERKNDPFPTLWEREGTETSTDSADTLAWRAQVVHARFGS